MQIDSTEANDSSKGHTSGVAQEASDQNSANKKSEAPQAEVQNESPQVEADSPAGEAAEEMHDSAKITNVKIEFPYSELVRAKIPKVFDVAEQVATDWVQDGPFESIPVENPLAQVLLGKSLRKAKDLEKEVVKVVESNPKLNEIKNQMVEKANVAKATIQILLKK